MWWKHEFLFTPPAPDTVEGRTLSILLTVFYHFGLFTTASNFAMSAPSSVFEHALQEKSKQGNEMVLGLVQSLGAAMVYPEATNVETNRFVRALRRERAHGRPPRRPPNNTTPVTRCAGSCGISMRRNGRQPRTGCKKCRGTFQRMASQRPTTGARASKAPSSLAMSGRVPPIWRLSLTSTSA